MGVGLGLLQVSGAEANAPCLPVCTIELLLGVLELTGLSCFSYMSLLADLANLAGQLAA